MRTFNVVRYDLMNKTNQIVGTGYKTLQDARESADWNRSMYPDARDYRHVILAADSAAMNKLQTA